MSLTKLRPDTIPLGSLEQPGVVPRKMAAMVIRRERYGEPRNAFRLEEVAVPEAGPGEVLVGVMSAGVNYNNIWACKGHPLDVIGMRQKSGSTEDFHIGGSDAAGIVYQVGSGVDSVKVGDEVVIQGGVWDRNNHSILAGGDPVTSGSFRAWGYETNWGSFAQFCIVQDYQCLPRPQNLEWDESSVYMLSAATIHRMMFNWEPNTLKPDEVVLIWGGAGGLGVMAIQLARSVGAIPVAVVNSEAKRKFCLQLGAAAAINRTDYDHWGLFNYRESDSDNFEAWKDGAHRFKSEIRAATNGRDAALVIEHPGCNTLPTSLYVCQPGGMVVTCGATTGYSGSFDLRYLWIFQKRIQGSHFAGPADCQAINELVGNGSIRPVLSECFPFKGIPQAHQLMADNLHPMGNMAIRIGY